MSQFFIDRPVFAWVLAIVVMLAGALSITQMPVSHYPKVAAPSLAISGSYPGASAQTVQDTVVQVIEQQMNGIDGLRYMSSSSESDGSLTIALTFEQGTDPDIAQVQIQNKLQLASPLLPEEVQRQGLRVAEYQRNFMMVMALIDESGRLNNYDLGNYIASYLRDPLSRVEGVGDFILLGSQYAMRIWLDPAKLHSYQLTPTDVANAVRSQNVQISAGQLGGLPSANGVQLNATVTGKTRLETPEEFGAILLRVRADGSQVRLRDVADVKLGSESFGLSGNYNGLPGAAMALRLASGANLLETSERVRATVAELEPYFPQGVKAVFPLETAPIVSDSIKSVLKTLVEAFGLVFLVMYLFLQNWRATLVPTLAIPVVLLGTMGVLYSLGYSINILTMYAMVLAIGLLVDDAIVVVENVERVMNDEKLNARDATRRSMGQIQGALVGIGLSLSAVFIPMAFFPGSAGAIYRQFSITIVTAMALSVLVALIFTPALCATLLRSHHGEREGNGKKTWGFFIWFNRHFARTSNGYHGRVSRILQQPKRYLTLFVLIVGGLGILFSDLPKGYLPNEDQGLMLVSVQLPSNSSAERTQASLDQVRDHLLNEEGGLVSSVFSVNGFNFFGRGQSQGMMFVRLKPWEEREGEDTNIFSLQKRLFMASGKFRDAQIIPAVPPAISEMGNASGVNAYLQDRAALGQQALTQGLDTFLSTLRQDPRVLFANHNGMPNAPQYRIEINDEKASAYQVSISDINDTMSAAWGSLYINDFIDRGRVKRVYLQGEPLSRLTTDDFNRWYVRNALGDMVPFAAFSSGYWTSGPTKLDRYNGVLAAEVSAQPAPGFSTSDLMNAFEDAMEQLPPGIGLTYTGISYEEQQTGNMATLLYLLSLVVVFLCLAALYESWTIPVSVMLVVPLGVLGAVLATWLTGKNNDVFFQVGLLTTIGLASKNAILIVEFARSYLEEHGGNALDAALAAAKMRLRPIIMTSLAFTFGVLPMALASGAGSESQNAIGVAVVGGMFGATFLAIFFVPLFFMLVQTLVSRKNHNTNAATAST